MQFTIPEPHIQALNQTASMLRSMFYDLPRQYVIHLSHTDLDGYGCNVLTNLAQYELCRDNGSPVKNTLKDDYVIDLTSNLIRINTYRMWPDFLPELDNAIAEFEVAKYHRPIFVLITDMGSIKVNDLRERYSKRNEGEIHFIIIDHHQSMYYSAPDSAIGPQLEIHDNPLSVHHGVLPEQFLHTPTLQKMDITTVNYHNHNYKFTIDMVLSQSCSATRLYGEMLAYFKCLHNNMSVNCFTIDVSHHDTGHYDTWLIPEHIINDDKLSMKYVREEFNSATKISTYFEYKYFDERNTADWIDRLTQELHKDTYGRFLYWTQFLYCVASKAQDNSRKFYEYGKNVVIVNAHEAIPKGIAKMAVGYDEIPLYEDVSIKFPAGYLGGVVDYLIIVTTCMENDKTKYAYNKYNQEILKNFRKDNPTTKALAITPHMNKEVLAINLNSIDKAVNCYELALFNGGGGHPGAAGFTGKKFEVKSETESFEPSQMKLLISESTPWDKH